MQNSNPKNKKKALIDKIKAKKARKQGNKDKNPEKESTDELKSKKFKFEMRDDKIEEMERIRVQKMESDNSIPTNREEFEKAILKDPNNIEMWIQYTSWAYDNEVNSNF